MTGLRFAMITTFYPPHHFGGDAIFVQRLTRALARRGHSVDVIYDLDAWRMLAEGPEPAPLAEPDGIRIHVLRSRLGPLSCLATQQTGRPLVHGRRIRRILEQGRFDVIQFHNVSLVGGPGILAYGDAIKLYMAHEHWLVCPMHVLWRHKRELCTGRQCLRCTLHHRRPPQLWRYTGLLEAKARAVDVFFAPSHFCAEKHREFGFPRDLEVLPPFLPDDDCEREPSSEDDGRAPFFLFVGRLEKIKGLQDVIPLFGDDAPAELWIAGHGNYEEELRRLAVGRSKVRFLGQCSSQRLRALYASTLGVVIPSICYEVFPLVVLEALRDGAPLVARRLGPFPELVEEPGVGLLFDTPEELERSLRRLGSDSALQRQMSKRARRAFAERWSEPVALERYFALIQRVARARGVRRVLEILGAAG